MELWEPVPPKQNDTKAETDKESPTRMKRERRSVKTARRKGSEERPGGKQQPHLTLAHGLFLLGLYFLVQGFPGQERLQHRAIWDAPLFL